MKFKSRFTKGALSASIVAASLIAFAPATVASASHNPCIGGYICGWDVTDFHGTRFGGSTVYVNVPDNVIKSAHNYSLHAYRAMNVVNAFSSQQLVYFSAGYLLGNFGTSSNKTDHFDRVV